MKDNKVKQCSCGKSWLSAEEIVNSPDLVPLGMAFTEGDTETAYYYFTHQVPECGTTFLMPVTEFESLIDEAIPGEKLTLGECCEEHCVTLDDLSECHQDCFFAPYRRLLLKMLETKRLATARSQR